MAEQIKLAVCGAGGRMGRAIATMVAADPDLSLGSAIGRDSAVAADGQALSPEQALTACDVVIDVSTAAAASAMATRCAAAGKPLVLGVTGLDPAQQGAVEEASGRIAVLQSGNFSLGVNLLLSLVRQAARALGPAYDIEIHEAHHRHKTDAPSGTALMLGRAAAEGRRVDLDHVAAGLQATRAGVREPGVIGFSVSRGGGVVGEHAVSFAGEREVVTLAHSALDRAVFAEGAVHAARWILGRPPGLYTMAQVLDLDDAG